MRAHRRNSFAASFKEAIQAGRRAGLAEEGLGAVVMLLLASCIASWIPARRAARVDPIIALRAE